MKYLKIFVWIWAVVVITWLVIYSPEHAYTAAQSFSLLLEQNL